MATTKSRKSTKSTKGKKTYKKKEYSEEEKAKFAEEKDKKISAAKEALIAAIDSLDSNESWINFLDHVAKRSKFSPSRLSFINQMLVYMQDEEATAVATYQRWRSIKRWPKKGSAGIMIFRPVPITIPIEKATPADIADGQIYTDKNGRTMVRTGRIFFSPMYVFDIAKTEGEDLPPDWLAPPATPDFEDKEIFTSSVEKLATLLETKTEGLVKGVQIIDREKIPAKERHPTADGWYSKKTKKIVVIKSDNRAKMFATLVHEAGHALMHGEDIDSTVNQKEIEAESVAYVVTKAMGLDTGVSSVVYLASWSKGKKEVAIKQIEESAKRIVRTCNQILDLLMPISDDEESVLGVEEPFNVSEMMCSSARRVREPKPKSRKSKKSLTEYTAKQLAIGTTHELEHVHLKKGQKPTKKQLEFAGGIARDHLEEDSNYYIKMKKCGLDEPKIGPRVTYPVGTILELTLIRLAVYADSARHSTEKQTKKKVIVRKIIDKQTGMIVRENKSNGNAFNLTIDDSGSGYMWGHTTKPVRYDVIDVKGIYQKTSEPKPKTNCQTSKSPMSTLKSTARKMGATIAGSDIKFKNSRYANEFEKILKEDQYTYTRNRLTFTVGCGEASLTIASLGEPSAIIKYKRGQSLDDLIQHLNQGHTVEVSETNMAALSKIAAKNGTNVKARKSKLNRWYVSVLNPKALGEPKPKTKRYILKKGDHDIGWKIYDKKIRKDVNWFAYKYDAVDATKEYNLHGYKEGHKIRKSQHTSTKRITKKPSTKRITKKRATKKRKARV